MLLCLAFVFSCNKDSGDTNTNTNTDTSTDTSTDDSGFVEPEGLKLTLNKETQFTVTALDYKNEPIQNAVVRFTYIDSTYKMDFTTSEGKATQKLLGGDVYITIQNPVTKKNYYCVVKELNEQGAILNAYDELEATRVHDGGTPAEENINDDRLAYITRTEGKYYATGLGNQSIVFFLFIPQRDGIYEFSANIDAEVGYYGAPINALQRPIEPLADQNGVVKLEVKNKNIGDSAESTTPYLIGIKANEADAEDCIFEIKRSGDPVYTIEDEPYYHITNTGNPQSIKLGYTNWNVVINDIDIESAVTVVLGDDGYYHLGSKDGDLIYVRVGSASAYLPSLYTVCETSPMSAYVYDNDGNFVRKEMYNTLINQYYALADEKTGLYPLDELMATAIQNHGNSAGWWELGKPNYLFSSVPLLNKSSAWLFACCTISIDKTAGQDQSAPIEVEKSLSDSIKTEEVLINAGDKIYFKITSPVDSTLKLTGVNENVVVIYNGTEYTNPSEIQIKKADSLEFAIQLLDTSATDELLVKFTIS